MGKSTLFNRLIGRNDALVHKTPGLTRDRKEATFEALGVKLKVIDTAGFEMENESKESLEGRKLNKRLVEDMLLQTRNALIYADLAIFMLDVRQGISEQDLALEQWLRMKKMAIRAKDESEETLLKAIGVEQGEAQVTHQALVRQLGANPSEARLSTIMQQDALNPYAIHEGPAEVLPSKVQKFRNRAFKNRIRLKAAEDNFKKQFKSIDPSLLNENMRVPPIIYVANKAENDMLDKSEIEEKFA